MESNTILYILLFLILIAFFFIFLLFFKKKRFFKPSTLKKEELIKAYEYEMLKLISKHEKDKEVLQAKKIEFLKAASSELHKNIFFDEHEAKEIVKKLASF